MSPLDPDHWYARKQRRYRRKTFQPVQGRPVVTKAASDRPDAVYHGVAAPRQAGLYRTEQVIADDALRNGKWETEYVEVPRWQRQGYTTNGRMRAWLSPKRIWRAIRRSGGRSNASKR